MFGIVHNGSRTIQKQRLSLEQRVAQLSRLLAENTDLRQRVDYANQRMADANESMLRQISADLHDGSVQLLGLALLKRGDFCEVIEETTQEILGKNRWPRGYAHGVAANFARNPSVVGGVGSSRRREIIHAIRTVYRGQPYVTQELAARMLVQQSRATPKPTSATGEAQSRPALGIREQQILDLATKGFNNREIAVTLGLSVATIKHYISLVVRKWGVRNRVEAVVLHSRKHAGS